jgi:uncharacterized protein YprB with RNaseH-like and TPR domain
MESSYTLCFSAKWYGEKEVFFSSVYKNKPKKMIKLAWDLLNEADVVLHYNGKKFDIPTLQKEFLLHGFTPPSPYRQLDLLEVAKRQFRFPSNKLQYVATALGLGGKVEHIGHALWVKCMDNDPEAWKQMEKYNKGDVTLLEKVYDKLLPWIQHHPVHSVYNAGKPACTNCGGHKVQRRGTAVTTTSIYPRYVCMSCGKWMRGLKSDNSHKAHYAPI